MTCPLAWAVSLSPRWSWMGCQLVQAPSFKVPSTSLSMAMAAARLRGWSATGGSADVLNNLENVVSAAVVDRELRLPYGSRDDVLPPVDLMWATLGVFRPVGVSELAGGDRLEGDAERLRYTLSDGRELHYEVSGGTLRAVELVEGGSVLQWVRLEHSEGDRFPEQATFRNLTAFRELKITRDSLHRVEAFDPSIWDPRE